MQEKSDFLFIGPADNIKFFRNGVNGFRILVNFFRNLYNLFRKEVKYFRLHYHCSVGLLSVVGRCSLGGIRQGIREKKESAILTKRTFSISAFLGRSLVYPLFVLGYLHGSTKDGTSRRNLNKCAKVHCVECKV